MARGRAVAIILEAGEKSELKALTRKHGAPQALAEPRWHVHFTPTSASWGNQVECFFVLLSERALKRGVFRSVADFEKAIKAYLRANNAGPKPFRWTKTANDILASVQRFCHRTLADNA